MQDIVPSVMMSAWTRAWLLIRSAVRESKRDHEDDYVPIGKGIELQSMAYRPRPVVTPRKLIGRLEDEGQHS